jgi:cytochrome P450
MERFIPAKVEFASKPLGVWGSLQAARKNILSIIPEIATRQPIVSGKVGVRWHMVMDPKALRHILRDNLDNYPKSIVTKELLKPAIGESLFIAEGAHWKWQRRAATPVFTHRNIANLGPIMSAAAKKCVERIEARKYDAIDLYSEMVDTTFDVISDVTFSNSDGFDRDALLHMFDTYLATTAKLSLLDIIGAPAWIPRPSRAFAGSDIRRIRAIADHAIASHRGNQDGQHPDLLDLLLAGEDPETKRRMTTSEVRDNLLAFIVAGHETTALTLSWAIYLLAHHPDIQNRARAEAQAVISGDCATEKDLNNLPLVRAIIDETLRLYPPAAFVSRTAQGPDRLCDRDVVAGDTVILPFYALHRSHLYWSEPDLFKPERFLHPSTVERFTYLPFGDGPRICIGASFALQEAVIILATLLAKFRFDPIPGKSPKPVMILTLRPEGGVWTQITTV